MKIALTAGEPGTVVMTSVFSQDTGAYDLRIDHADPRVWISDVLWDEITGGRADHTGYVCPHRDCCACDQMPDDVRYVGDVVTIRGVNRKVVYRISRYLPEHHVYEAEWPD